MDTITILIISVVAILGFLWKLHHEVINLHKDNADLRERMARMEDLLEGFVGRPQESQS